MAIEKPKPQNQADPEEEPTPKEIEKERHRAQTWKHPDDGKELPDRDRERPLRP
jgi:hypothetical protein